MSDVKKERDPRRDQLLILLREGRTLEEAATLMRMSSRTIRRWRADDPELEEAVQDAIWAVDDEVERVTYKNCIDPDPAHNTLRMFWLKSRRPEVYRESVKLTVAQVNVKDLSDDALRAIVEDKGTGGTGDPAAG